MSIVAAQVPATGDGVKPAPTPVSKWRLLAFCSILILLPALFLLSSIPIVRSASFPRVSADPFLLYADYPFSLKHEDCDVLVFGDSTAATGIDPTVVRRRTGLKTCNIAQSQSILEIFGTGALDDYLKNNRPPEYLVFQFAPETFSQSRKDLFWPEGLTLLLRRDFGLRALITLAANPKQAYGFAIWAIKARVHAFHSRPDFSHTERIFQQRPGLLVLPKPSETSCSKNWPWRPPDPAWIRSLREKYSKAGVRVIVNVSPLPSCTGHIGQISSSLSGLTDNRLPLYPVGLFCDLDRHLTLEGADRASAELAGQILREKNRGALFRRNIVNRPPGHTR